MAKKKLAAGLTVQPIFSREHYESLKKAERLIHDLFPVLDKMHACGMDCSIYRAQATELKETLSQIEREFMTPVPT